LLSALLHRQAARGALTVDGSGTEGALPDGWSNPTRTWWLVDYPRQRRCGLIVFFLFRLTFVSVYIRSFVYFPHVLTSLNPRQAQNRQADLAAF
jgi:hypothetical protein